jgi:transcriptional regulator GlxA family with amidase domain
MQRKKVGIVIFDDVEVLDFCGPFEVFSVTRLNGDKRREEPSPFEALLVAERSGPVTASGGMQVLPHVTFANSPALEILVVPGGWGTRVEMNNAAVLAFIKDHAPTAQTLASVCTGSLLLGKSGVLDGLQATTHWQALDLMAGLFPNVDVDRTSHIVEQGKVITSAGISAGIDMALIVVARHYGEPVARATAQYMEYPYPESNARRVPITLR